MIFGSARVSTKGQGLAVQQGRLRVAGCEHFDSDTFTSTMTDRPRPNGLMARRCEGDSVVIAAVDRLARDPTNLLVIAREMRRTAAGLVHTAAKTRCVECGHKSELQPYRQQKTSDQKVASEPARDVARSYAASHTAISRLDANNG